MTPEQANLKVNEILSENHVSIDIRYMGEALRDSWSCDSWRVTLRKGADKSGFRLPEYQGDKFPVHQFAYYTGLGHRIGQAPVFPRAADVLHSVLMDAEANTMSFPDWCDTYGYESDSIKALTIYMECCTGAKELGKIFDSLQRRALNELLSDY